MEESLPTREEAIRKVIRLSKLGKTSAIKRVLHKLGVNNVKELPKQKLALLIFELETL